MDVYVAEQLARALQPSITDVHVKWNTNQHILHKVPEHAPPVFAGDRVLFYAVLDETMPFDHSTTVDLFTNAQQQPIGSARIDHVPAVVETQTIKRLAAKALLRELLDVQEPTNKESLINISIKYGILCPHTAFIGVEKRLNANSESNVNMELREVPIMINKSSPNSSIQNLHYQLRQTLHYQQQQSMGLVLDRGDSLDCLMEQSACLSFSAGSFYKSASKRNTASSSIGSVMQTAANFFSSLFTKKRTSAHYTPDNSVPVTPPVWSNTNQPSSNLNTTNNQTTKVSWPTDEQKLVDRFIELQEYDGLWKLTADDVKQLTGKSFTSFSSSIVNSIPESPHESIIGTAIVMNILEMRCSSLKTLWQALSNKAEKRLKEFLGEDEIQFKQLMQDIHDQLQ